MGFFDSNNYKPEELNKIYELQLKIKTLESEHQKVMLELKRDHDRNIEDLNRKNLFSLEDASRAARFKYEEQEYKTKQVIEKLEGQIEKLESQKASTVKLSEEEKKIFEEGLKNKYDADLRELTTQKEIAEQKILYLEKAFENLGFDVKDMKDILNKLVDGLVSKNEINIIR